MQCEKCKGIGLIKIEKEIEICLKCVFPNRCCYCENVPILGNYEICKKCYGDGEI